MFLTITGELGSGKSTISKLIASKYNFEIYSAGKIQRELAKEKNMSTLEFNNYLKDHKSIDNMIDDAVVEISKKKADSDIIFDSRMAWHFVENSFKIYVFIDIDVATKRVLADERGSVEKYSSFEEARQALIERKESESKRFNEIYGVNTMCPTNYNLIIDSTFNSPEKIVEKIMERAMCFNSEQQREHLCEVLISPKSIVPTKNIDKLDKEKLEKTKIQMTSNKCDVIEPIFVKKQGGEYCVKSGHYKFAAALQLELDFVNVEVEY